MYEIRVRKSKRKSFEPISKRELTIVQSLSHGKVHKVIANEHHLATSTVSTHIRNVSRKLGINKETELSRWVTEFENSMIHFK
jgi:DNA-binding NarL/FixJ family response regulator